MSAASKKKIVRNWTKPTQISKHLFCSVCSDVFRNPIRLFCTHTFCRECIEHWSKANTTCPECRQTIVNEMITEDRLAARIINDFEVSCVNKLCDWKDSLELLEKHVKTCEFEKALPKWAKELKSEAYVKHDKTIEEPIFGTENDALYEKLNEEMPKGSLTERLLKKDTKILKTLKKIIVNPEEQKTTGKKKETKRSKSLRDIETVFDINLSDEETTQLREEGVVDEAKGAFATTVFGKRSNSSTKMNEEDMCAPESQTDSTRNTTSKMGSGIKSADLMAILEEDYQLEEEKEGDLNNMLDVPSELLSASFEASQENLPKQLKEQNKARRGKLEGGSAKRGRPAKVV